MVRWLTAALGAALGLGLIACGCAGAKDAEHGGAFIDAKSAGPDFAVQGEYVGKIGTEKYGAQVIARGDGKFEVEFLPGGLPGDGWDAKSKIKSTATTRDGKTAVTGQWKGEIADSKLTGKTDKGEAFTLQHIIRHSKTEGEKAPQGAIVLFDGKSADQWQGGKIIEGDLLRMGTKSKMKFGSCKLHVEFRLPFVPKGRGQGLRQQRRLHSGSLGNSGTG